jgi:hypothetical protein
VSLFFSDFDVQYGPMLRMDTGAVRWPVRYGLDGLLPARLSRIVQLPQIADGPLSWTIGSADGHHQRPIPVLLTVFAPMVVAQKHAEVMVSGEKLQFNWVGLHYIAFSIDVS